MTRPLGQAQGKTEPRALALAGLVVLLGVVAVVLSFFLRSHVWPSSFLLNLGVAMFLAIPLFVVTSLMSRKIEASSKKLEKEIDELRTETDQKIDRLTTTFDSRDIVLKWGEGEVVDDGSSDLEKIGKLLDSGAASDAGLIVPFLRKHGIYVQFSPSGEQLLATAIDASEVYEYTSSPTLKAFQPTAVGQSASLNQCAAQVIESLRSDGVTVSVDAYDPIEFASEVKLTISEVAKLYRQHIEDEPGGMRMVVNDGWAISNKALFARRTPYVASFGAWTMGGYGWRPHILEKTWVDEHDLDNAIRWAYSLGLVGAKWAEGNSDYPEDLWHPGNRLTERSGPPPHFLPAEGS